MSIATLAPEVCGEPHSGLYPADMVRRVMRGVQDIRLYMGAVFEHLTRGEHVVFTRRGTPVGVLVDMDWYRKAAQAMDDPTEY